MVFASAQAQTVLATLATGPYPNSIALNPATNKVYVTSPSSSVYPAGGNSLTVIDGASNTVTTIAGLPNPTAVATNPVTSRIYVVNSAPVTSTVTVLNGATNAQTSVSVGAGSIALAVNPVTNKIYVANSSEDSVTVIDGATNTTATVSAGAFPSAVAVNTATNKIYVVNTIGNTVTVIDGVTHQLATVNVGRAPVAVAINPVTNKIYVANSDYIGPDNFTYDCTVTEIDGLTNAATTILTGTLAGDQAPPTQLAINPVTNKLYATNSGSNNVTVIDGATNAITNVTTLGIQPNALTVDSVTNRIYVANQQTGNLEVIDGATNKPTTLAVGGNPASMAVNLVTNRIYVVNQNDGTVSVIAGAGATVAIPTTTTLSADANPDQVGSRVTFTAYIAAAPTAAAPVPSGTVTFSIDGVNQSTLILDSSGHTTFAVNSLPIGAHAIKVTYAGTPSFAASSAALTETIQLPPAATPSFASSNPAPGIYYAPQSVALVDTTANAAIYYTLDGTTPTAASTKYVAAIQLDKTTTVKAVAVAAGYAPSAVSTGLFTIDPPLTPTPVFSLKSATYTSTQWVSLTDALPGAASGAASGATYNAASNAAIIYYTTNNTTPTTASTVYTAPITVSFNVIIRAIAVAPGHSPSAVATVVYAITPQAWAPTFSLPAATYKGAQTVRLGDTTPGAVIYYTTNGTTPTAASAKYTAAIAVSQTTTIKALVTAPNYSPSTIAAATYTITP
jgi:YVTN family beta-propeller protein